MGRITEFGPLEGSGLKNLSAKCFSAIAVFLVVGSLLHPDAVPPFGLDDGLVHVLLFYSLAMLFLLSRPAPVGLSLALILGLAGATEVVQLLIPMRQAAVTDLVANLVGIGAALASWWLARWCCAGADSRKEQCQGQSKMGPLGRSKRA